MGVPPSRWKPLNPFRINNSDVVAVNNPFRITYLQQVEALNPFRINNSDAVAVNNPFRINDSDVVAVNNPKQIKGRQCLVALPQKGARDLLWCGGAPNHPVCPPPRRGRHLIFHFTLYVGSLLNVSQAIPRSFFALHS